MAEQIKECDAFFAKIRDQVHTGAEVSHSTEEIRSWMKDFKETVKRAEKEVMSKCHILLVTCTAANEHRLHLLDPVGEDGSQPFVVAQV